MTDLSRYADWTAWLTAQAEADPDVRCVWVGGSAATGGYDEWSDLDLDVLCTPGTSTAVYDAVAGEARDGLRRPRRLGGAASTCGRTAGSASSTSRTGPGCSLEPTRIIDLHVSDLADQHSHLDVRRHGTPIVLHDPDGLIVLEEEDVTAALRGRGRRRSGSAGSTDEWLVNRAIARGHVAEAVDFYLRFALAAVVRLVRVEHCPWRHDFGLRYLREDLPPDVADQIEELVPGATSATLEELSLRCFAWLDELLARSQR